MTPLRLFLAFETPAPVRREAADLIGSLRSIDADVSWEHEEKLHCTLKFLGDTPPERLAEVRDAVASIANELPPFSVRYTGLGYFPNPKAPRVFWLGVEDPDGGAAALAQALEEPFFQLGYRREQRPYHPHVTLGRIRSPRNIRKLTARTETLTLASGVFTIEGVHLFRSELRPSGSVYSSQLFLPLVGKRRSST